jgi:hypothetical protein
MRDKKIDNLNTLKRISRLNTSILRLIDFKNKTLNAWGCTDGCQITLDCIHSSLAYHFELKKENKKMLFL